MHTGHSRALKGHLSCMTSASNEFETTILTGASLRVGIGSLFTCDSRLCCTAVLHVARCPLHVARCPLHAARCTASCMLHVARLHRCVACCTLPVARCILLVACCTAARRDWLALHCVVQRWPLRMQRAAHDSPQMQMGNAECARDAGRNVQRAPCSAQYARWDGQHVLTGCSRRHWTAS